MSVVGVGITEGPYRGGALGELSCGRHLVPFWCSSLTGVASGMISMYSYFELTGGVRAVTDKCQAHFLLNAGQEGGQCLRWVGLA